MSTETNKNQLNMSKRVKISNRWPQLIFALKFLKFFVVPKNIKCHYFIPGEVLFRVYHDFWNSLFQHTSPQD